MDDFAILSIFFAVALLITDYLWYRSVKQADKQISELQIAASFNIASNHEEQIRWYNEGVKARDNDIERILRGFTGILTTSEIVMLKSLLDTPLIKEQQ